MKSPNNGHFGTYVGLCPLLGYAFIGMFCFSFTHILRTMRMRVRGKLATPRVVAVRTRGAVSLVLSLHIQFSLQHRLAASVGIILGKAECR